jgi:hypothetical protein
MIPRYADEKERRIVRSMARAMAKAENRDPDELIHPGEEAEHTVEDAYIISALAQYRAWRAMWHELSQGDELIESGANAVRHC